MRKGDDGEKREEKKTGKTGKKRKKKITAEIVATNVVASRPPNGDRLQRQPLVPIIIHSRFTLLRHKNTDQESTTDLLLTGVRIEQLYTEYLLLNKYIPTL